MTDIAPAPIDFDVTECAGLHLACCMEDKFFCKAPFHPECKAGEGDNEDDCCEPCILIGQRMQCPRQAPTHAHCPFSGRWCPK